MAEDTTHPFKAATGEANDGHRNSSLRYRNSLEDYPLFLVSRSNAAYKEAYELNRSITVTGEVTTTVEQQWKVVGAGEFGLPRGSDQDVYMALNELLYRIGGMPEDKTLYFSFYEMIQILGWETDGKRRRRLRKALQRIASTTLVTRNAFVSDDRKAFLEKTFKPFSLSIGRYRDPHRRLEERHKIIFDPFFAEKWIETYKDGLDLSFYWKLEGHLCRRLYRLIEDQAASTGNRKSRSWQADLFEVKDLIPLADYGYSSQIKRTLASAHEQLVEKGFLNSYRFYQPEGEQGPTVVRYEVARKFDNRSLTTEPELDPVKASAIQRLVAVTANYESCLSYRRAAQLVEEYGAEYCLHYAERFPEHKEARGANLLVSAIKEGYEWEVPFRAGPNSQEPTSGASQTSSAKVGEYDSFYNADKAEAERRFTQHDSVAASASDGGGGEQATVEEKQRADEIYQQIVSELSGNGSIVSVGVWFDGIYARSLSNGVLTLVVPNEQARDYIGGRFKEGIEQCLSDILAGRGLGGEARLELVVCGEGNYG